MGKQPVVTVMWCVVGLILIMGIVVFFATT
jgi:hypothetical protein